ncbi:hypothetical protein OBBRIDRAFT_776184 [Obba rivulosa]|uniref:Uncharacterized protein n=1 Tax=Obba rivulosa TaxID=1052685 RepID=A0A8E2AXA1_9APHY|nr:hypothetical protein OBBRIDRAFT_776184 [Obba rivulosa]
MSLGDADAKFSSNEQYISKQTPDIPPSPSRENPGQVYPKSDPRAAPHESIPGTGGEHEPGLNNAMGNPYALESIFDDLDHSLTNVIAALQHEESSVGASTDEDVLLQKFKGWREELLKIRTGTKKHWPTQNASPTQEGGGLFTD